LNPSTITALRSEGHRSIVVIRNYRFDPITAVSCRAKEHPFNPPSNLFRPRRNPRSSSGLGWRRRVPPPGPKDLFRCRFIAIAALLRQPDEYRGQNAGREGAAYPYPGKPLARSSKPVSAARQTGRRARTKVQGNRAKARRRGPPTILFERSRADGNLEISWFSLDSLDFPLISLGFAA